MKRDRRAACFLLTILLEAPRCPPIGASSPDAVNLSEYRERRVVLADALRRDLPAGTSAVLVLDSAPESENLTFRQESNLYYLTGTEIPGSALVLLFDRPAASPRKGARREAGHYAEYLYLPETDYRQERWTGTRPGAGGETRDTLLPDRERREAMTATGFDRMPEGDYPPRHYPRDPIQRRSDLPAHLTLFLRDAAILYHPAGPGAIGAPLTPDLAFLHQVRQQFPTITLRDPGPALGRMRQVKSPAEIALLRRAAEISCQGQRDALRQARSGMTEYQVQAVVEYRFAFEGARRPAYPSVVGAGPDACILHYDASLGVLRDGDLLLLDAGAEYRRYSADLSRTFPVSGRFTDEQRKIYGIVLKAREAALAVIRPGLPFEEIDRAARRVITGAGYGSAFPHGTSHFLGLDVHDPGETGGPLLPGMVLTVEPGIYLPEKGIGIRIEDDVLVTPGGAQVLSDCAPREADAVEMQRIEGLKSGGR